jgi:hypothetical protein
VEKGAVEDDGLVDGHTHFLAGVQILLGFSNQSIRFFFVG